MVEIDQNVYFIVGNIEAVGLGREEVEFCPQELQDVGVCEDGFDI